jgi:hypothetical protein
VGLRAGGAQDGPLGRDKAVPLPPSARALLEPWLEGRGPDEVVFSPARAREEMYAERRGRRVSKIAPSQQCRRKPAASLLKKWTTKFTDFGYAAWVRGPASGPGSSRGSPVN